MSDIELELELDNIVNDIVNDITARESVSPLPMNGSNSSNNTGTLGTTSIRNLVFSESLDFERKEIFDALLRSTGKITSNVLDFITTGSDFINDFVSFASKDYVVSERHDLKMSFVKEHHYFILLDKEQYSKNNVVPIGYVSIHNPNPFMDEKITTIKYVLLGDHYSVIDEYFRSNLELIDLKQCKAGVKYSYFSSADNKVSKVTSYINPLVKRAKESFYPWLNRVNKSLNEFIDDYLSSDEAILILLGPPGTGKTTFCREVMLATIREEGLVDNDGDSCNRTIYATADSYLISHHPGQLLEYMASKDNPVLCIFEDSDILLGTTRKEGNWNLSSVLNIADGLAPASTNKPKIIFTANITDIKAIDEALLRPGRCYAIVYFDTLDIEQASTIIEEMGIEKDFDKEDYSRRYSLAEILSVDKELKKGPTIIS